MATKTVDSHIEITPDVLGGQPRIAGTRIGVIHIATHYHTDGWSAERIADEFPAIDIADVFAALTYYADHREEIDQRGVDILEEHRPMRLESMRQMHARCIEKGLHEKAEWIAKQMAELKSV